MQRCFQSVQWLSNVSTWPVLFKEQGSIKVWSCLWKWIMSWTKEITEDLGKRVDVAHQARKGYKTVTTHWLMLMFMSPPSGEHWATMVCLAELQEESHGSPKRKLLAKDHVDHHILSVKRGGDIMAWACFAASWPGQPAIIDGTMNSELYQQILKENVRTSV